MTYYWFSLYTGEDWEPSRGYHDKFALVVRTLRHWFQLAKVKPGLEAGTGFWREYLFTEQPIFVCVDRFIWDRSTKVDGFISIQFFLNFRLARGPNGEEEFFKDLLLIQFPEDYPRTMPFFRLQNPRYSEGALQQGDEAHHLLSNGWMCLLENKSDWKPDTDTIITAINLALKWIDTHYHEHGW